jgi:hypothetical protein
VDELLSVFPSLSHGPRELDALQTWFDSGGPTEQATHAAAFVLERLGVAGIEFAEEEALHVWDAAHRAAYCNLLARLKSI